MKENPSIDVMKLHATCVSLVFVVDCMGHYPMVKCSMVLFNVVKKYSKSYGLLQKKPRTVEVLSRRSGVRTLILASSFPLKDVDVWFWYLVYHQVLLLGIVGVCIVATVVVLDFGYVHQRFWCKSSANECS